MKTYGFTLIELLVVIAIIVILGLIVGGCVGQSMGCTPGMTSGQIRPLGPEPTYAYKVSADERTMARFNDMISKKNQHITNTSSSETKVPYFACRQERITTEYLITVADN